tara:strand:- start:405 stop:890 length:486 start_codon:yes stop_codon:yes gene_type:complete
MTVTPTYTLIDTRTLATAETSVTFGSISATGKGDLVLVVTAQASADSLAFIEFNSDTTAANYSFVYTLGNGSSGVSGSGDAFPLMPFNTSTYSQATVQVMDFAASDKHKTSLVRDSESGNVVVMRAVRWANTSPITSLKFKTGSGNFAIGSTFHLYQIVSE